jgi:hypothetical protein
MLQMESYRNWKASSLEWEILLSLPRYRLGNTFKKLIHFTSIPFSQEDGFLRKASKLLQALTFHPFNNFLPWEIES